ncbi:MAG: ATP-binding protein [Clostridiaceae bacterium]|nr:ATP-binding protein [Clostridiaceae bacterium]
MIRSIAREIAQIYEQKRQLAEKSRDSQVAAIYAEYPEIESIDRELAIAGADLLLEAIDPGRPANAARRIRDLKRRRVELLKQYQIPLHFDQVRYSCSRCQDTGYIDGSNCRCYQAVLVPLLTDESNMTHLHGISFKTFDPSLFSNQTNPETYQSPLSPRQQIMGLKKAGERFVECFDDPETRSMLFIGKPGTGKTFLMACIGHALLQQGHSVLYVSAPGLFDWWQNHRVLLTSFNPDPVRLENSLAFQSSLFNSSLLLIDDLGTESASNARYGDLLSIIDNRHGAGRKIIISSNIDPAQFRDQYDERLLSRLIGGFSVYRFFGEDVRLKRSERRR